MISLDAEVQLLGILSNETQNYEKILLEGKHYHKEGVGLKIANTILPIAPYLGYYSPHSDEVRQAIFDGDYPAFLELIESLVDVYPDIDFSEIIERAESIKDRYRPGDPTYIGDRTKEAED